jgi:hypothetical protein
MSAVIIKNKEELDKYESVVIRNHDISRKHLIDSGFMVFQPMLICSYISYFKNNGVMQPTINRFVIRRPIAKMLYYMDYKKNPPKNMYGLTIVKNKKDIQDLSERIIKDPKFSPSVPATKDWIKNGIDLTQVFGIDAKRLLDRQIRDINLDVPFPTYFVSFNIVIDKASDGNRYFRKVKLLDIPWALLKEFIYIGKKPVKKMVYNDYLQFPLGRKLRKG